LDAPSGAQVAHTIVFTPDAPASQACYNAWNHLNLNNPNTTVTSGAFGTITGQSPSPQQFQLALKLAF